MLTNSFATSVLIEASVDAQSLMDYTEAFFTKRDKMTYEEVCELCLELRGTQAARVKHTLDLRHMMAVEFGRVQRLLTDILESSPLSPKASMAIARYEHVAPSKSSTPHGQQAINTGVSRQASAKSS